MEFGSLTLTVITIDVSPASMAGIFKGTVI